MKMIINHPQSPLPAYEDEEILGEKIEEYLKKNGFHYAVHSPSTYVYGITVWLEVLEEEFGKNEQIQKLSDLASFFFDTLKLNKSCLHFVFGEYIFNGEGKFEVIEHALDKITFEELTGEILPSELESMTVIDFLDKLKR